MWNPDCKGPCDCPGEEVELVAQAPIATEAPAEERPVAVVVAVVDESWSLTGALARAWDEGHSAGDLDSSVARCLEVGIPVPEGQPFPSVNPYRVNQDWSCPDHNPVQHRDRKPKWCNTCGRDAVGKLIGKPRG